MSPLLSFWQARYHCWRSSSQSWGGWTPWGERQQHNNHSYHHGHNHNVLLCLIIYHCLCIVFVIALSFSLSLHCLCHCLCYCHHLCRHHCHRHLQKYLLYQSKLLMCLIMTSVVVAKNQSDSVWIDPDCVIFIFSSFEL